MTKNLVRPISISELTVTHPIENSRTPDWRFRVDEASAGRYVVEGRDVWGHSCSLEGSDPDALLSECVDYACSH
jgi:hypothetical protein